MKVFTERKKLQAIADKYYNHLKWVPKIGDYYTLTRNDMDYFKIVGETKDNWKIKYFSGVYTNKELDQSQRLFQIPKKGFLEDFGEQRVYIAEHVYSLRIKYQGEG